MLTLLGDAVATGVCEARVYSKSTEVDTQRSRVTLRFSIQKTYNNLNEMTVCGVCYEGDSWTVTVQRPVLI